MLIRFVNNELNQFANELNIFSVELDVIRLKRKKCASMTHTLYSNILRNFFSNLRLCTLTTVADNNFAVGYPMQLKNKFIDRATMQATGDSSRANRKAISFQKGIDRRRNSIATTFDKIIHI